MAEFEHILEALNAYKGDTDTLNAFVQAAETDLGPDWAQNIMTIGADWDTAVVEKLNHAYNYYAATASWSEIQGYLNDADADATVVAERLPTLAHWLSFFGAAGEEPVRQLRERFNLPETVAAPVTDTAEPAEVTSTEAVAEENTVTESKPLIIEQAETAEAFQVRQAFQDIEFLDKVQAWTAARCVELGNIEVYAYKFYGFQVDVMEHARREISKLLEDPAFYPLVESVREKGVDYLRRKLSSLESDIQVAYDNAQTDVTPLLDMEADAARARALLGGLDTSNTKEFLGPAPDGFEMVEDPYEMDDAEVTKAYRQLEETEAPRVETHPVVETQPVTATSSEKASGRKMSFSLGNKTAKPKPQGEG